MRGSLPRGVAATHRARYRGLASPLVVEATRKISASLGGSLDGAGEAARLDDDVGGLI